MRILVVGQGAREHALLWALAKSPEHPSLFAAPGNGGTATLARSVPLRVDDVDGIVTFVETEGIDLVVVGPEAPLALGLADALRQRGRAVFGPGREAARLESSKGFTKAFADRHSIPTARYILAESPAGAAAALDAWPEGPVVVKADGLAAGKGVVVAESREEARAALDQLARYGEQFVLEERMEGPEVSVFAIADGERFHLFLPARDHKRVGEGNTGPNTGGMGGYAPVPEVDGALLEEIGRRIIAPTIAGMAAEGSPFQGLLYAGLMLTAEGPKLLEYNVRFGDPETGFLLPLLQSDLLPYLWGAATGALPAQPLAFREGAAIGVVLAAKGYPDAPETGGLLAGVADAAVHPGIQVFHAGTRQTPEGYEATGGRVLLVVATGEDRQEARRRVYRAMEAIHLPGGFYRRDLGL